MDHPCPAPAAVNDVHGRFRIPGRLPNDGCRIPWNHSEGNVREENPWRKNRKSQKDCRETQHSHLRENSRGCRQCRRNGGRSCSKSARRHGNGIRIRNGWGSSGCPTKSSKWSFPASLRSAMLYCCYSGHRDSSSCRTSVRTKACRWYGTTSRRMRVFRPMTYFLWRALGSVPYSGYASSWFAAANSPG